MSDEILDRSYQTCSALLGDCSWEPSESSSSLELSTIDLDQAFAEVTGGRLQWRGSVADIGFRLSSFHRRLVSAIVHGTALPIECRWIREADRLVSRLNDLWDGYAEARRFDPDPESWIQTLEFASGPVFTDWCHTLCCAVLGEPIDRIPVEDGSGDEQWFSLAADDLALHLQALLRGDGAFTPHDPIRIPWRRSA